MKVRGSGDTYISNIKGNKKQLKKPKHKLTLAVDYDTWAAVYPYLEGQFSELMEAAMRDYLSRVDKKSS